MNRAFRLVSRIDLIRSNSEMMVLPADAERQR